MPQCGWQQAHTSFHRGNVAWGASGETPPPAMTVTLVDPESGVYVGGTWVTIIGTGFEVGANVTFDGIGASDIEVVSDTEITCFTPAHDVGFVYVTVINPDESEATKANGYEYVTPTIITVTPDHGPTTGGTSVTITGTWFEVGAMVTFGAQAATSVVVVDSNTITCVTQDYPAGYASVKVTNPDTSFAERIDGYLYTEPVTTSYLIEGSSARNQKGVVYPTVTSESISYGLGFVGKRSTLINPRLFHRWRQRFGGTPGYTPYTIPMDTISSATLSLPISVKDIALESYESVKIYLGVHGSGGLDSSSFDTAGASLLATVSETSMFVGTMVVELDAGVLNAHHGQHILLLMMTEVERTGGGLDPANPSPMWSYCKIHDPTINFYF